MMQSEEHELFVTIQDINNMAAHFSFHVEEDIHSFVLKNASNKELFRAARLKEIQGFLHGFRFQVENRGWDVV